MPIKYTYLLRHIILTLLIISVSCKTIQAQGWQWGRQNTGGSVDAFAVTTDKFGNVFASGFAVDTNAVAFGNFIFPVTYARPLSVIVKYDNNGNIKWAKELMGNPTSIFSLATDKYGNLIALGYYGGPISIDSFTLYNPDFFNRYFIAKFDSSGNLLFVTISAEISTVGGDYTVPGGGYNILSWGGMALDSVGNIYIAGNFDSASIKVGGTTIYNHDPSGLTDDIFIAKYDASGNPIWATGLGGSNNDDVFGVTVSSTGNVYVTGNFLSSSFQVGSSLLSNPYGIQIGYVGELSPIGVPVWGEAAGGANGAYGVGLVSDAAGNVYLTGSFGDEHISFGNTTISRTYPGTSPVFEAFILQLSNSDSVTWEKTIGSPSAPVISSGIAMASCGQVWICAGWGVIVSNTGLSDSANIDGHILYFPDSSIDPVFTAGYNLTGGLAGYSALQSGSDDQTGIACDPNGNVFLCGDYFNSGISDFVMGNDTLRNINYSPSNEFMYLAKYANPVMQNTIHLVSDSLICSSGNLILKVPNGYSGPYLWSNTSTENSISVNIPGNYWVTSPASCGLPNLTDTFHVELETINITFSLGTDSVYCNPVTLKVPVSGLDYLWQNGDTQQAIVASTSGVYYATAIDLNCKFSDTVSLTIIDLKQENLDTLNCVNALFAISLNVSMPAGASVLWSTGIIEPSITIKDTGVYFAIITDSICQVADTISVNGTYCYCESFIPTAFTPLGAINNSFKPIIDPYCNPYDYEFSVFDRWGELVFYSNDPSRAWDGKYLGQPVELGVYMYLITYHGGIQDNVYFYKGDVTLVR